MMMRKTCDYFYSQYNYSILRSETIYCQNKPRHVAHMKAFPRPQWLCDEHKERAVELSKNWNSPTTFECALKVTKNLELENRKLVADLEEMARNSIIEQF